MGSGVRAPGGGQGKLKAFWLLNVPQSHKIYRDFFVFFCKSVHYIRNFIGVIPAWRDRDRRLVGRSACIRQLGGRSPPPLPHGSATASCLFPSPSLLPTPNGLGERCKLPCGSGRSPAAKRFWCIFRLKSAHLLSLA